MLIKRSNNMSNNNIEWCHKHFELRSTCACNISKKLDMQEATHKSDGGSSKYYQLEVLVREEKISSVVEGSTICRVQLETGDVIRALVDNDFDLGNIVKACRRIHQAKKGEGKEGTKVEYDCKKIQYFLDEWYKAYCMEQL